MLKFNWQLPIQKKKKISKTISCEFNFSLCFEVSSFNSKNNDLKKIHREMTRHLYNYHCDGKDKSKHIDNIPNAIKQTTNKFQSPMQKMNCR